MKDFLQLTEPECLAVYPSVEKNAAKLYVAADTLAANRHYGPAISLLILGSEEYIKCFCLFLEGHGFELRKTRTLQRIFFRHTARHYILRDTYSVWMVAKSILSISRKSSSKQILSNLLTAVLHILPAMSNHEWWQKADQLKQKGLYADYQGALTLPSDLTKEEYDEAVRHTHSIPSDMNRFIERINKMNDRQLKEFRQMFKEAEFESLIAEAINRK